MTAASRATLADVFVLPSHSHAATRAIRAALVASAVALTALAAQVSIPLPFTPVPFTFQPMVVLVSGVVLGARLGCLAQVSYLAAGIAGLPVFAASPLLPPGALRLIGPTGGYLLAYPLAAWVTGRLAERGLDRRYWTSIAAMAAGMAVVYAGGALWLAYFARTGTAAGSAALGLQEALAAGVYPFLLADTVKTIVAAGVAPAVWRLVGR
jgi:biotin transport system substrate-specific component